MSIEKKEELGIIAIKDLIIKIDYYFKIGNTEELSKTLNIFIKEISNLNTIEECYFILNGINKIISNDRIKKILLFNLKIQYEKILKNIKSEEFNNEILKFKKNIENLLYI